MNIKPIRNESDYQKALERLEIIFDAKRGTDAGDELEILAMVIDNYENDNFPINMPDPIAAIKFRMQQMSLKQKDLVDMIGFESRVSEIMNRKRKLTLDMIRKLNVHLHIPTDVLIQDYSSLKNIKKVRTTVHRRNNAQSRQKSGKPQPKIISRKG